MSAAPVSAKRSSESNRLGGSLFFFFLLISLKISVSVYYTKTPWNREGHGIGFFFELIFQFCSIGVLIYYLRFSEVESA